MAPSRLRSNFSSHLYCSVHPVNITAFLFLTIFSWNSCWVILHEILGTSCWNCFSRLPKPWNHSELGWNKVRLWELWTVLFIQHLDSNFRGKNGLTSGQKWPNFGAKRAQLQFPAIRSKKLPLESKLWQILPTEKWHDHSNNGIALTLAYNQKW